MMKLTTEWKAILAKAWSIRLAVLASLLSGLEAAMPYLQPDVPSDGTYAKLAAGVALSAAIARLVAQAGVTHEATDK